MKKGNERRLSQKQRWGVTKRSPRYMLPLDSIRGSQWGWRGKLMAVNLSTGLGQGGGDRRLMFEEAGCHGTGGRAQQSEGTLITSD